MHRSLLLSLLLLSWAASAPAGYEGTPLGEIYLSAAPDRYEPVLHVEPGAQEYRLYLVLEIDYADIGLPEQQATNGVKAWECEPRLPPEITVLSRTILPETSIPLGLLPEDWIIGTGQNLQANTTPYRVVEYRFLILGPETGFPLLATTHPVDPGSFSGEAPGWGEFLDSGECTLPDGTPTPCIRRFAEWGDLEIRREPLPNGDSSWGAVKARFHSN